MSELRHDWTRPEILDVFAQPFADLMFQAQAAHRRHWDPNSVQLSTLLSIKTGGCVEDCKYCAQSAAYETGLPASRLMEGAAVRDAARRAKASGASRFCMGAAWRELKDRDLEAVSGMVREVKAMGLETCMTLGMVTHEQARALADAGLDYYNHNVDTSAEFYARVITTRTYEERLKTLETVRAAGMKVCAGGIIGMGESRDDRAGMLETLANLNPHPESVPINMLVPIPGTPLGDLELIEPLELVRTIAAARVLMPASYVRLSAGRKSLSDEAQALCYLAGANSIFYGDMLLTTDNPDVAADRALFDRLGLAVVGGGAEAS
jgi:biotin synthase